MRTSEQTLDKFHNDLEIIWIGMIVLIEAKNRNPDDKEPVAIAEAEVSKLRKRIGNSCILAQKLES